MVLHPDKFHQASESLQDGATRITAFTSLAYSCLMDDIKRAEYLLQTEHQLTLFDESRRETDEALAKWVFATLSEIEDCEREDDLQAI